MRTVAPAKINWTLEVLGRREDGYHEIRSVMQTIDLCDELSAELSDSPVFETARGEPLGDDDLIVRAARELEGRVGRALPVRIRVQKRIPVASGLGGGSSDAAAVLRLLNQMHRLGLSRKELATVGAAVGSDVPFFVYGGTALVEGRGEKVTPLRDQLERMWLVLVVPRDRVPNKTASMYARLTPQHFTDGQQTDAFFSKLAEGKPPKVARAEALREIPSQDLRPWNVFDSFAYPSPGFELVLLDAVPEGIDVAGSGPSLYSVVEDEEAARRAARRVQDIREVDGFAACTFTAAEATVVSE